MPDDLSAEMLTALTERDRVREYLSRLQGLKDEGSIAEEQYETAQADYSQRIEAATNLVESLRPQLQEQLDEVKRTLEAHRSALGKLEARFKVQEIPLTKLQSDGVQHRRAIRTLQEQERQLTALVDAESAEGVAVTEPAAPVVETPKRASVGTAKQRTEPAHIRETPAYKAPEYEAPEVREGAIPRTPLRIASLVAGALLLVSIFLPWVAPTKALGTGLGTDPGVVVTFLAGLAGLVGGLAAIGFTFIPRRKLRGGLLLAAGVVALAALVAAIVLEEIPLFNSYFRQLATMREGFLLYITAAAALAVLGIIQMRRA
jgi:hypothetical protein